jgi:signal transduction histidine kinase
MWHSPQQRWTEATLNAVATPVLIADAAHRLVLFVNRAATKFIGTDAVGTTMGRAFGLETGRRMTDAEGRPITRENNLIARAAGGEDVGPVELLWHCGGDSVALVCFAERVPPAAGESAAIVMSFFDVTQLRKVQQELARAERARDEFVQLAAHELRTPLTSLRLRIASALRKHADLPRVLAVGHAVDRMSKRVEQLIDVAGMREHLVVLHPEHVDLVEILREAASLLESQARWAKSSVTIAPTPPIFGSWDVARFTQVIASVLSNAVKFGAGNPVELVPSEHGDEASVSVIDHGIGISESDREVIFERFQRRASAAHFGGLGLDLWITREVLRQMRGTITVDVTPGGGATFVIRVPKLAPSS